ncbi:hypothetical protein Tco_0804129 [Tanacetum coccineum]|uniref:Uncharacterized protein n=1 Tax=Tanacetum coccineum TaxID=301880 RepID=A0ABQ5A6B0_9ASTR
MDYLPQRRWSSLEKKRSHIMIEAIDMQLKERRMMRSFEKFPWCGEAAAATLMVVVAAVLGDLDRSCLILENTLGLGLGLRERLDLCFLSCSLVLIVLDSEYRDVPEPPPNYDWQQLVVVLIAILLEGCVGRGPTSVLRNWLFSSPNRVLHGGRGLARSKLFRIAHGEYFRRTQLYSGPTDGANLLVQKMLRVRKMDLVWLLDWANDEILY